MAKGAGVTPVYRVKENSLVMIHDLEDTEGPEDVGEGDDDMDHEEVPLDEEVRVQPLDGLHEGQRDNRDGVDDVKEVKPEGQLRRPDDEPQR